MAYQVVLYDSNNNNQIINIVNGLEDIQVIGNNVEWTGGGMFGINVGFAIFDDSLSLQIGDTLLPEQLALDKKELLRKLTIEESKLQQLSQDLATVTIYESLISRGLIDASTCTNLAPLYFRLIKFKWKTMNDVPDFGTLRQDVQTILDQNPDA